MSQWSSIPKKYSLKPYIENTFDMHILQKHKSWEKKISSQIFKGTGKISKDNV